MRIDSSQFYIPLELFFPLFHIVHFCFFDIRKAFANATHKRGVDFLIYSLKFIAGVAAVFTIITNISSIHNNLFTNEHLLEEYYDANYFTVKTTDFNAEKEEAFLE